MFSMNSLQRHDLLDDNFGSLEYKYKNNSTFMILKELTKPILTTPVV